MKQYTNAAQQRLLEVITILADDVVVGTAPSQIATRLGVPASYITRDLNNLRTAGWAVYSENTGRWLLAGAAGLIGVKVMTSLASAAERLEQARNRFTPK